MNGIPWRAVVGLAALLAAAPAARPQGYVGFVYPAGGQRGATFRVTLGGQGLEGASRVYVSGAGVKARLVEYNKRMSNQEISLLNEQLREIKPGPKKTPNPAHTNVIEKIERLLREYVNQPACAAIANLVVAEITLAPDAEPGLREIRVVTARGPSNPLVFVVGEVPEVTAPRLLTCPQVILGKEGQSLRRKARAAAAAPTDADAMMASMSGGAAAQTDLDDDEIRLELPCTVNGQIAPGTVDRFRFAARKGQRLVLSAQARDLIPYMADAVPGWFQPVLVLLDAAGREVAYQDDYRFKPDPVVLVEVPADGEYLLAIHDAIFRGREDFVYRLTVGELPFLTGVFPLGGRAGESHAVEVRGWNLAETRLTPCPADAVPGLYPVAAKGKAGHRSNRLPFAVDTLPEALDKEPNQQARGAQRLALPVMVNGRIGAPDDRDVFQIAGRAGEEIVAEVFARRLESPLDSELKLIDAAGKILALSDDREDLGSGLNTHHADSYLRAALPADGTYFIQIADTQHRGGDDYAYRLRVGPPQPDFALRVVPSSVAMRSNATASVAVHLIRKDGFAGPIKLGLKDAPPGFDMAPVTLSGTQTMTRVSLRATRAETTEPVALTIQGIATNAGEVIARVAAPAEDRMQAFLWRHLVPVQELKVAVLPTPPPVKPAQTAQAPSRKP